MKQPAKKTGKTTAKSGKAGTNIKQTVEVCVQAVRDVLNSDITGLCSEVSVEYGGIKITASKPNKGASNVGQSESMAGGQDRPDMLPTG